MVCSDILRCLIGINLYVDHMNVVCYTGKSWKIMNDSRLKIMNPWIDKGKGIYMMENLRILESHR